MRRPLWEAGERLLKEAQAECACDLASPLRGTHLDVLEAGTHPRSFAAVRSRQSKGGRTRVRRQMFGRAECGPCTQWDSNSLKEEGRPPATARMNPEDAMLSEISQTQKDKCWATPSHKGGVVSGQRADGGRWGREEENQTVGGGGHARP